MIHYHGTPITPATAAAGVLASRHAFVSFARPDQLEVAIAVCQTFALDNGAFSAWRSGNPVSDWAPYYEWVGALKRCPAMDFAIVPDVIDGGEADNDALLAEWPHEPHLSAPVWHMHESISRFERLAHEWPRVALGSSGEFATIGTQEWWSRITEALSVICDEDGYPPCRLHGLRMLDPKVFSQLPFASADSTNVARNIGIDQAWRGSYLPPDKEWRAKVLAARIESTNSAPYWQQPIPEEIPEQCGLF